MTTTSLRRRGPAAAPSRAEPGSAGFAAVPVSSEAAGAGSSRWEMELALALLSIAGLVGFRRVFTGAGWIGPVMGTALGVQAVCRLTRRWVPSRLGGALIDLLSVAALTVWTVVPSSTRYGLPLRGTWRTIQALLLGVGDRMNAATVPVHPAPDFLLLAVAGAGVVGLAGSWITFRLDRTLAATLPSLSAFVMCCALGTRSGRSWTVILEVVGVPAFVLVGRLSKQSRGAWFAGRRARSATATVRAAVPGIVVAGVLALAVVPSLHGADGHGPLGWRSKAEDSPRIVISPLVSLATRLLHQSTTTVFTVRSRVPSYWRLTSLDYFDGTEWNARDTYEGIDTKLSGVIPAPRGTRTVREQFAIEQLDSVWLPLAFDPEAVTGAGRVSYDPRSGSLLTPHATSNHLRYTVTSLQYLDTLSVRDLRAAPALGHSSSLTPYLQLPSSVPVSVKTLAKRIVAGKSTEYGKAIALQNYFYGPSFTYSLHPPSDGAGTAALTTFLFGTHTGYCQQFAGAYAVLARAVGLPTRLAIGFTEGQATGDVYRVTDADAHTWPEVWFPRYGWVPFEPTKGATGAGFAIPGATIYTGDTAAAAAGGGKVGGIPTAAAPTTVPAAGPTASAGAERGGLNLTHLGGIGIPGIGAGGGEGAAPVAPPPPPKPRGHGARALEVIGIILAALALLAGSNLAGRRWRWARRRRRALGGSGGLGRWWRWGRPAHGGSGRAGLGWRWGRRGAGGAGRRYGPDAVAVIWEETAERLAWHGHRRRPAETPRQFADRVTEQRKAVGDPLLGSNLHRLAELLTEADFSPGPPAPAAVEEADRRSGQIASVLDRGRGRPERWVLRLDPRLAWAPRTLEAPKAGWLDVTLG